jgi:hypothetical protein
VRQEAIHEHFSSTVSEEGSSDRSFGFIIGGFFVLLGLWPLVHRRAWRPWEVALGAALVLLGLVRPSLLHPLNKLWTRLGLLLGKVVNPVVLGVLYYLVITPAGWILRLAGKDPLKLRPDPQAASYWILRQPPGPAPETMPDQF